MARVAGSVTVAEDESAAGSGLSKALYDAVVATEAARLVSLTPPPTWLDNVAAWEQQVRPLRLRALRAWAREAEAAATGMLAYEAVEPPVGGTPDEIASTNNVRAIATATAGVLSLELWDGAAWNQHATITVRNNRVDIYALTGPRLMSSSEYGVDIDTEATEATNPPSAGVARVSYDGARMYVLDSTGRSDAVTRTRVNAVSSGTLAIAFDYTNVLSGTATPSPLPPATANDVGRIVAFANRTASSATLNRDGSDLIDGATSLVVPAGGRVLFECIAAGDWLVWGG